MNIKHLLRIAALVAVLFSITIQNTSAANDNLTQYVNQYIGTGGHGHTVMGANAPFGLVIVGPTEPLRGWDWTSGYHYSDNEIIGFGHMHLSGTGIGCLGDIALLPVSNPDQRSTFFTHDNERMHPGYYSLRLTDPDVLVELTATKRCAMHRYTFGKGAKQQLALDLSQCIGWDTPTDCMLSQESPTRLIGYRRSTGWAKDRRIYFAMEFSRPVYVERSDSMYRALLSFNSLDTPLIVKVSLSPVEPDKAKANMQFEMPGWDFDAVVSKVDDEWNTQLSRI